jgi:hypothetical protein
MKRTFLCYSAFLYGPGDLHAVYRFRGSNRISIMVLCDCHGICNNAVYYFGA